MLEPGGRFLLLLNHPLLQTPGSGWIDDHILEEQYWRVGPYLHDDATIEEVAPGVDLPFMHRPLSRYVHVMGEVGLLIDDMDEPPPPPGFLAEAREYARGGDDSAADAAPRPSRGVSTAALEAPPVAPDAATPAFAAASERARRDRWPRVVGACLLLLARVRSALAR